MRRMKTRPQTELPYGQRIREIWTILADREDDIEQAFNVDPQPGDGRHAQEEETRRCCGSL